MRLRSFPGPQSLPPPNSQQDLWKHFYSGEDISEYGMSDTCVKTAQVWLQECLGGHSTAHSSCAQPEPSPLPTRIVDVNWRVDRVRIYTPSPGEKAPYIALSHCWGGNVDIKLKESSLERHSKDGIKLRELPRTFHDAVIVSRQLGIRYLWIDCLCIIQDSAIDWKIQAGCMGEVYQRALFTIAAHAAPNSSTGFLNAPSRQTKPSFSVPTNGQYPDIDVRVREAGVGVARGVPWHGFNSVLGSPKIPSKLSTRGWVFQEDILAPRTLIFAATEMAWTCYSTVMCECGNRDVVTDFLGEPIYPSVKRPYLHLDWSNLVSAFTSRNLTVSTDRLPAIAGIAKVLSGLRPGDRYLSGLWEKDISQQLLWKATNPQPKSRYAKSYAPTWSWASLKDVHVLYPLQRHASPELFESFRVLEISYQAAKHNEFMPVKDANILVSALTLRVKMSHSYRGFRVDPIAPGGFFDDIPLFVAPDHDDVTFKEIMNDATCGLVFLLITNCITSGSEWGRPPSGLLLKQLNRSNGSTFERLGLVSQQSEDMRRERSYTEWETHAKRQELKIE
jgi:hypothetical protein